MIVFLNDSIVIKITFIQHPSKNRSYPVWFCNLTVHFLVKHKDPQGCNRYWVMFINTVSVYYEGLKLEPGN